MRNKEYTHTYTHTLCFSDSVQHLSAHNPADLFWSPSGSPPFASRRQRKSSGGPGAGSSIKLGFLCPLLVEPPSAGTQDVQDSGRTRCQIVFGAEDSGLGIQTEVRRGQSLCALGFSVHIWNGQLPECACPAPSLLLFEPADNSRADAQQRPALFTRASSTLYTQRIKNNIL